MSVYYSVKRQMMRVQCLFGRHQFKMGVPAKSGGGFGCLWCGKQMPPTKVGGKMHTISPTNGQNHNGIGTKLTFNEQLDAQLMQDAQRQVRRLFGGKA